MTKAIASYPAEQRESVILRRVRMGGGGAGYHSAVAAARILGLSTGPHFMKKRNFDRKTKAAGKEFAKAMAGRAKTNQLRRKPSIKNTPRIKKG